jgi:2-polyprenyl-3-methyl-5-hydroxy-6-metoxy-1,4-benzoquinol methylase
VQVVDVDNWDEHWAQFAGSVANNPAQHYRHGLVAKLVSQARPKRVLDIGSGSGDLLVWLDKVCPAAELVGLEMSQVGVDQASARVPRAQIHRVDLLSETTDPVVTGIAADVAVCCEVLEHLDDPRTFLERAKKAMSPGATLIVTVPGGPRSAFDRLIGHRRHYAPAEIAALLTECGFTLRDSYGSGFPFFNLYRLTVIARGDKLAGDVGAAGTSRLAGVVMRIFGGLFRLNLRRGLGGWQTVAIATLPALAPTSGQ